MKRYRAFLPILILIAIGIALLASGVLNRFRPENLAHEQAALQAQIALHPLPAAAIHIGAVTLAISTGIPGVVVLILAGGMLFGTWLGTLSYLTSGLSWNADYVALFDEAKGTIDVQGWGWWHLIAGLLLILVGIALLGGQRWARITAIVLVAINAFGQITLIDVQPWLSLAVLALDIVVIYALTVHGREIDARV